MTLTEVQKDKLFTYLKENPSHFEKLLQTLFRSAKPNDGSVNRKLLLLFHPDKKGGAELFRALIDAYTSYKVTARSAPATEFSAPYLQLMFKALESLESKEWFPKFKEAVLSEVVTTDKDNEALRSELGLTAASGAAPAVSEPTPPRRGGRRSRRDTLRAAAASRAVPAAPEKDPLVALAEKCIEAHRGAASASKEGVTSEQLAGFQEQYDAFIQALQSSLSSFSEMILSQKTEESGIKSTLIENINNSKSNIETVKKGLVL